MEICSFGRIPDCLGYIRVGVTTAGLPNVPNAQPAHMPPAHEAYLRFTNVLLVVDRERNLEFLSTELQYLEPPPLISPRYYLI